METKQIQKRLAEISREEQELKTAKKNIKEQLENDLEYVEARNEAKKAAQKKKTIKDQIMSLPENQKMTETIKNTQEDLSVLKDILSAELFDYFQKSKKEEIVDAEGNIRKFKFEAKLISEKGGFGK
ncbi:hypothetical protein COT12_02715 [Candidatus Berkelbacteria bacterium CG08_land_8_20_14_0_20_39_8]|uniref:Uncharacterized protein n=1 Tax=Candidatus Berkelbacteria bacterium CG08_land_8_20_14_0_20_39_8 TaxID=1974511 RepID=A0A2M6YBQ1_9BACT|nr:MAG: hypothetical protein COT12_02715 [Candidatus Berkelbacteria bacterium CG08_land_8_20_14_0_20_39_8]